MGPEGEDLTSSAKTQAPPTWERWSEAVSVVGYRPNLRRTLAIALIVGTLLVAINQTGPLSRGDIDAALAGRMLLDYLVPFCVSNLGVLAASRRKGANP